MKAISKEEFILSQILTELTRANMLKEKELKQQRFFIELIEEVLPISDGKKRAIHQKVFEFWEG